MVKRWCALFSTAFLVLGCGGGGSGPNPPQLYIPITTLLANGVLGVRDGNANLPIVNTGGSSLTFEITVEDWMTPGFNRATVPVGGTSIVNITFACEQPGIRNGSIAITTNDPEFESGSIPVELVCSVPALEFTLHAKSPIEADVGQDGEGSIEWSVDSPWEGQPAVGYTVRSDQVSMEVSNSSGSVAMEERIENTLTFTCDSAIDEDYPITIELGANTFSEDVNVICTESDASNFVAFYQGPLIGWLKVAGRFDGSQSLTFTQDMPFVTARNTAVVIESTRESGSTARIFADPELNDEIHAIPAESNFEHLESGLIRTRTVFELPNALVAEATNLFIVLSSGAVELNDPSNQMFSVSMAEFEFATTQDLDLNFVPIVRHGSYQDFDAEPIIEWFAHTMPVTHASYDFLAPMSLNENDWSLEFAAEELFHRYVERGKFDEFLIGVYDDPSSATCGVSFENLPLLMVPNSANADCDRLNTFARRIGQALGISDLGNCQESSELPVDTLGFKSQWFDFESMRLLPESTRESSVTGECQTNFISSEHYAMVLERLRSRSSLSFGNTSGLTHVFTADEIEGDRTIQDWRYSQSLLVSGNVPRYPFAMLLKGLEPAFVNGRRVWLPSPVSTDIAMGRLTLNGQFYSIGTTNEPTELYGWDVGVIFRHVSRIRPSASRSWVSKEIEVRH